ncbi:alpha/beta fold hydrolase [Streptomyces dysideae]|uniref:Alpha/beta hydrolase n=1 Tax=Streptomyces dysideae TaxID=909626 RepID=A0A101USK0_9ACTN|nr:alpha/beta hydrolase [Streptomyces dysideae]KUO16073.1 alpha/beta hydrolase [Streptomyces dysideae]
MTVASELSFFASADGDLAYLDTGSGDPVVLLHSGYVDHRVWHAQIPALAAAYRVIAPDVRGHGSSANATEPYRWADDLAGLLRHLDAGPAVLVGLSMGGLITTNTALEYPDLVRAVVTCGAATGEFRYTDAWTREIQAEMARTLAAGDIEGWLKAFLRGVAGEHRTSDDIDQDIARRLRGMAVGTLSKHTPGEKDWFVPVTDTFARAPEIDVPLLTLNGGLEPAAMLDAAERLARTVRHGRAETVEGVGHYPNLEKPEVFNRVLLDFLHAL